MEKWKNINNMNESPFKRNAKRQATEINVQKKNFFLNAIKQKRLSIKNDKRGSISNPPTRIQLYIIFFLFIK